MLKYQSALAIYKSYSNSVSPPVVVCFLDESHSEQPSELGVLNLEFSITFQTYFILYFFICLYSYPSIFFLLLLLLLPLPPVPIQPPPQILG